MSVINKMLRDLDQRQTPAAQTTKANANPGTSPHLGVLQGTVSLNGGATTPPAPTAPGRSALWLGLILTNAALVVGGGAWLWHAGYLDAPHTQAPAPPVQAAPIVVIAPPVEQAASAPVEAASAPATTASAPATVTTAPTLVPKSAAAPMAAPASAPPAVPVQRPATPPVTSPISIAPAPPALRAPTPIATPVAVPVVAAVAVPVDATTTAQRQQQATKEAMAHAQSLWNAGSHDAAIELMQAVLATTERTVAGVASPAHAQLLSLPVRELTRMQLAVSRPAPVLELLTRLEPLLSGQADLWAVRANAAQRMGRHQDSVHAYTIALQSRPNEQRWLLGAAVSLAALGQIASAGDMADKARAVGAISKDVQAYLRQSGVPIKD